MDNTVDPVAVVALIVSLIALLVTLGQLLQQYFATAEGYRRCKEQVMGGWAVRTNRKFRWREFRFETFYAVPKISFETTTSRPSSYAVTHGAKLPEYDGQLKPLFHNLETIGISGTPSSFKKSMLSYGPPSFDPALVSWIPLLWTLQFIQYSLSSVLHEDIDSPSSLTPLIVTVQHRSWDFVPPDIVKPLAVTTVSGVAILAKRLGMVWEAFEPGKGRFIAEGNGYAINSITVLSAGTILQFSCDLTRTFPLMRYKSSGGIAEVLYLQSRSSRLSCLPSYCVDRMGFGFLEGFSMRRTFSAGCVSIGSEAEVASVARQLLSYLSTSTDPTARFSKTLAAVPGWAPGLVDFIPMFARNVRIKGLLLLNVPSPSNYPVSLFQVEQSDGFLESETAPVIFRYRLKELLEGNTFEGDFARGRAEMILTYLTYFEALPLCPDDYPPLDIFVSYKRVDPLSQYQKDLVRYYDKLSDHLEYCDKFGLSYPLADHELNYDRSKMEEVRELIIRAHSSEAIRIFDETFYSNAPKSSANSVSSAEGPPSPYPIEHDYYGCNDDLRAELMHRYFDNLDVLVKDVRSWTDPQGPRNSSGQAQSLLANSTLQDGELKVMWIMLMYRSMLWHRLHPFLPGKPLPGKFWNSQIPLFIG